MIIWIASYPKSGNTWIRSFLTSYLYSNENEFNFDNLKHIQAFGQLKHYKNNISNFNDINQISNSWIKIQEKINQDKVVKFFKTHNGLYKIGNSFFTNKQNTLGAIYIVRDPRDIAISASHHYGKDHKATVEMLFDNGNIETFIENGQEYTRSVIGSWSNHFGSWNSLRNDEKVILRYEDLHSKPEVECKKLLKFISRFMNIKISDEKISKSLQSTNFNKLKDLEKNTGFVEQHKEREFFRSGNVGEWKTALDKKLSDKIENRFLKEMSQLGYLNN